MPRNKITDLRNHLFEAIESLLDPESNMDVEKAQTVANLAQVIVNSAKVELQFAKMVGGSGTGFIPLEEGKELGEGKPEQKNDAAPKSGKEPLPLFGTPA